MVESSARQSVVALEPLRSDVIAWRIVTLFLLILGIDFAWEVVDKLVTTRLRGSSSDTGLLHAWEHLKFETCALGLVSLLLVVFEVLCIHCNSSAAEFLLYIAKVEASPAATWGYVPRQSAAPFIWLGSRLRKLCLPAC